MTSDPHLKSHTGSAQQSDAASAELHSVLAEYLRRQDAGEPVDVERLCHEHPAIADALRSYCEAEAVIEKLKSNSGVPERTASDNDTGNSVQATAETLLPGNMQGTDHAVAGRLLGKYRLLRLLGQGAMGEVYLAEHTDLDRPAAIKIPKFGSISDADLRERFYREAKAAARLDHPRICRIYDVDDRGGTPFIAMAYIDGQPLSRFVGTSAWMEQRRVAAIVREIALGLAHAHERGVIHRDLKSGNVLVDNEGHSYITDFGLARLTTQTTDARLTADGAVIGTPAYMSPEQVRGRLDDVTAQSDIYALGVILFELLTGRLPFQGDGRQVMVAALEQQPPRPSTIRGDVDPTLETLCLDMLEKKPADRPATMQAVAQRLESWLRGSSTQAKSARAETDKTQKVLEESKQRILSLIQAGQVPQAIKGLEKMSALTTPAAAEYATWAKNELPKVQSLPSQLREGLPALIATAKKMIAKHDYGQAAELLQQVPQAFRDAEAERLIEKSIALQDECDLLLLDLQDCARRRSYQGIEDNLKRFLKLKPGHTWAQNLWESLQTYSRQPSSSRKYRYDEKGRLQPLASRSLRDNWALWGTLCFIVVFGLMTWGVTIYLRSGDTLIAVEVDEQWLAEHGGEVTLSVDGDNHTITAGDIEITVSTGEHGFSVKSGDVVVHDPQRFTVERDGRQVLMINANGINLLTRGESTTSADHLADATDDGSNVADAIIVDAPATPLPDGPAGFVRTIEGHTGIIKGLDFSPDGRTIASVSPCDSMLRIWDVETQSDRHVIDVGWAYGLSIHPDSEIVAVSNSAATKLINMNTGVEVATIARQGDFACSSAFSPDGKYLAVLSNTLGVKVYDVSSLPSISLASDFGESREAGWVSCVKFLPDSEHLLVTTVSDTDGTRLLHVPSGRVVRTYQADGVDIGTSSHNLAVHPTGRSFFIRAYPAWSLMEFDVSQVSPVHRLEQVGDVPEFMPDGRLLVGTVGGEDEQTGLIVRNPETGNVVWQSRVPDEFPKMNQLRMLRVSPDGRYAVTGGMHDITQNGASTNIGIPNPLYLWRLPQSVWPTLKSDANEAPVSVTTPGSTGAPALIQLDSSHEVHRLIGPVFPVGKMQCVGDLLVATDHEFIYRYSLSTRTELPRLDPGSRNNGIAVSDDGRLLAIAKEDTIEFWDAETRELLSSVDTNRDPELYEFFFDVACDPEMNIVLATMVGRGPDRTAGPQSAYLIDRNTGVAEEVIKLETEEANGWGRTAYSRDTQSFIVSWQPFDTQTVYRFNPATRETTSGSATGQGGNGDVVPLVGTHQILVPSYSGFTRILDIDSWATVGQVPWHDGHCDFLACASPDGQLMATCDTAGEGPRHILIRRTSDYQPLYEIMIGDMRVTDFAFTSDSRQIAFAGDASASEGLATAYAIRVWRLPDEVGTPPRSETGMERDQRREDPANPYGPAPQYGFFQRRV